MKNVALRLQSLPVIALASSLALPACGRDEVVTTSWPGTAGAGGPGAGVGADAGLGGALPPPSPPPQQPDASLIGSPNGCFSKRVNAFANKPDILIVLDRSESMNTGGRWEPSKGAVKSLTTQFQALVDFGLALFPGVGEPCAAGSVDVPFQPNGATAIGAATDATMPQGYTPLGATLEALSSVLGDRTPQLDAVVKPASVLLVTDGEPTCEADGSLIRPTATSIERANAAVERLRAQNITTYVIGYSVANAAGVMDGLAQRGGTERYYPVEDEAQLAAQFTKITTGLVSCEYQLDEVPAQPNRVKVVIDGSQIYLGDPLELGFVLEGKTIKLQSGSCQRLRDGVPHSVDVTVECTDITPGS